VRKRPDGRTRFGATNFRTVFACIEHVGSMVTDRDQRLMKLLVIAALVLVACESGGANQGGQKPPVKNDAADGYDSASDNDVGTYQHGVYTCCGPGKGLTCCKASKGLLGYEVESDGAVVAYGHRTDATSANCFRYGGHAGACLPANGQFDGKDICSICCPGLTAANQLAPVQGDSGTSCELTGIPSLFTCIECGNGICESNENECTCPADCPK
jgi:hypothetical protein